MAPFWRRTMPGIAPCMVHSTPSRSVRSIHSQSSAFRSVSSICRAATPALHTRASSGPRRASARRARATASSCRETSAWRISAAAPMARSSSATARACSSERP